MSEPCLEHLPPPAELARLVENVRSGRPEAFVGTGHPGTVLSCPEGEWVLGDVLAAYAAEEEAAAAAAEAAAGACGAPTNAGTPCKRAPAPGSDRCAKHQDGAGETSE